MSVYAFVNQNKFNMNNKFHQYHTRAGDQFRVSFTILNVSRFAPNHIGI